MSDLTNSINSICIGYRDCRDCSLGGDDNWAYPRGSLSSRKMLLGEAAGKIETETRRFFTGPAGKLLDKLFQKAEIDIDSYYITNCVKHRPVAPNGSGKQNLTPTREQVSVCRKWLEQEIAIISPLVIVPMGRVAIETIMNKSNIRVGDYIGKEFTFSDGYSHRTICPVYHPSYLLRNHSEELNSQFVEQIRRAEIIYQELKEIDSE